MVFEESTFVLPSAPAKAPVEPAEPAVSDPSEKPETLEFSKPAAAYKAPKIEVVQPPPVTSAAPVAAPKEVKRAISEQRSPQTAPKREPKRPQWDTSNVDKARNAQRKPHQPQWSPAGAAPRKVRPGDISKVTPVWSGAKDSQPSPLQNSPSRTAGGGPVKHALPWTLEGGSVLDKRSEDGRNAEEDARKDSAGVEAPKKLTRQELRTQNLEKGWVGNGTGRPIGESDTEEDCTPRTDLKKMSPAQRFGIEGIIRTLTGDGPEGMSGHGKNPNGVPYINCRAGGVDDDRASARAATAAKRGRSGKCSCTGCSVM